jgi:ABC-2 type transport system permease protein
VVGNANLVTKAAFPRMILPLSMVLSNLVNFLLSGAVLCVYLLVARVAFGAVFWLPLIVLSQAALCAGVALLFSSANVFFRDTEHILSVVMLAWFFLTPVIYPVSLVFDSFPGATWVHTLFFVNPMTGLLTAYRGVLISAPVPSGSLVAVSFAVAWGVMIVGVLVFQKAQARFGDEL